MDLATQHGGRTRYGLRGMWCWCHTATDRGCRMAVAVMMAVVLLGNGGGEASAQTDTPPADAPPTDASPVVQVDESHGRRVHRIVENWVQAGGRAKAEASVAPASLEVRGLLAVRVTLRNNGITLGTGDAYRGDLAAALDADAPAAPVDLIPLVAAATDAALAEALDRVRGRTLEVQLRAATDPDAPDVDEMDPARVGRALDVDLQLATMHDRIVIPADAPEDEVYARFAPGYHGLLAMPADEPEPAVVWPATALAQNASPHRQMIRLLTRAGLAPTRFDALGRPGGVPLYRFRVIHVVRPPGDMPTLVLTRGGQLLPRRFVGEATLNTMADRMALHLFGRFIGEAQVRGTYLPTQGRYDPELAEPFEAALASYALVRYVAYKRDLGSRDPFFDALTDVAANAVRALAADLLKPDTTADPATAALCLLTITHAPAGAFDDALRDRLAAVLRQMQGDDGRFGVGGAAPDGSAEGDAANGAVPQTTAALILAALADLYDQTRDGATGQAVADGLAALWDETGGNFNAYALPWIALAHESADRPLADTGLVDAAERDRRKQVLLQFFTLIGRAQVVEDPPLGPDDVLGGIVLTPGPAGSPPNPDWHTAQLLSFIATVSRDAETVTPRDRIGAVVTAESAARFLGQLMMDGPTCFAVPGPAQAIGGVRLTLWDNRLAVPPTAFGLLALVDFRSALEAVADELEPAP